MTALSAGSVTYTIGLKQRLGNSKVFNVATLALASGQTYPTGGVPLVMGNMGCPNTVYAAEIVDAGTSGYVFNVNTATNKLQMFVTNNGANLATLVEVASTVTPGAVSLLVEVLGW